MQVPESRVNTAMAATARQFTGFGDVRALEKRPTVCGGAVERSREDRVHVTKILIVDLYRVPAWQTDNIL